MVQSNMSHNVVVCFLWLYFSCKRIWWKIAVNFPHPIPQHSKSVFPFYLKAEDFNFLFIWSTNVVLRFSNVTGASLVLSQYSLNVVLGIQSHLWIPSPRNDTVGIKAVKASPGNTHISTTTRACYDEHDVMCIENISLSPAIPSPWWGRKVAKLHSRKMLRLL